MDTIAQRESHATGRRRLLHAAGLGGLLAAALPVLSRSAGATLRPTAADVELLSFAQSLELAAVELYHQAAETLGGEPALAAGVIDVIRSHHQAYADSFSGMLGRDAQNAVNQALIAEYMEAFSDPEQVLVEASALEDSLMATHLMAIGELEGTDAAELLASVVIIEARHNTALLQLTGSPTMPELPMETVNAALSPDDYPVEG